MLTSSASRAGRRGIVLVLVLAMLGLLALVAITFATYAGQSKISNRNFMLSLFQPQADELIDFGMSQLITDTNDIRSVIRGHSLARDMFGNDATNNSLLSFSPASGLVFSITQATTTAVANQYLLTTNIVQNDASFYGYSFTRWIMRVAYGGALTNGGTGAINQSFEILADSGYNPQSNGARTFLVYINPIDAGNSIMAGTAADPYLPVGMGTALYNPTQGLITQLPGLYIATAATNNSALGANTFTLDGRWQHAFNGPGVGGVTAVTGLPASYYGNYRYTGPNVNLNQPGLGVPGPGAIGMDEDYDACDLENWFMAVQSADGQVIIPSFHRPGIIRVDGLNANDWLRLNQSGQNGTPLAADSAARILRPCKFDGHDPATFPDLLPDATTGQIPYDVDNDGDGKPDSVWLDLGYPARKDSSGRLYKPLYAFMVIGLNGRIPLNTAGNLAAQVGGVYVPGNANNPAPTPPAVTPRYYGGPSHASHLGNSISEVDPLYALQNTFDGNSNDQWAAFAPPSVVVPPSVGVFWGQNTYFPFNSQVDNVGIDVRLTQLRNLLAGTRPPVAPGNVIAAVNQDNNYVFSSTGPTTEGVQFLMPNGIAEIAGQIGTLDGPNLNGATIDGNGFPFVVRTTTPVPGRWGEAQSIPGVQFPNPYLAANPTAVAPQFVNVVGGSYSNPVRAGYSLNITDIINGLPPDAGDDNFNAFDPFPLRQVTEVAATIFGGEVNDQDFYDIAGGMLVPVERMRRWVTPADINGTGSVTTFNAGAAIHPRGADVVGRVEFTSYFRPAGSPGVVTTNYIPNTATGIPTPPTTTAGVGTMGAIVFPNQNNPTIYTSFGYNPANITATEDGAQYAYLPDTTSNPLHGLESSRFPNQGLTVFPQFSGGSPAGVTIPAPGPLAPGTGYTNVDANDIPQVFPTYDYYINANFHTDGLNEADEMNLYAPNPLLDSPFGPTDIEWLYRQQDVDGASLSSRLKTLAPISFTNGRDGARRRRLFSLDFWDLNNFSWTADNPVQTNFVFNPLTEQFTQGMAPAFPLNSRFTSVANAGFTNLNVPAATNPLLTTTPPPYPNPTLAFPSPTPALAHRDKKINLNYPLPVSNDPNEPIRQKWITDAYVLAKSVLPPQAIDTPEELAQLSQYLINIVDFRDTDGTMTHWINPDVVIAGVPVSTSGIGSIAVTSLPPISLVFAGLNPQPLQPPAGSLYPANPTTTTIPLDQYGMEYNPVALNEVLAYSFVNNPTGASAAGTRYNRFFVELVNTQTSPELSTSVFNSLSATTPGTGFNPALDLGGSVFTLPAAGGPDPYSGGTWDIIFTGDDPYSRPDPYRGQLVPYANIYAATPLNQNTFSPPATTTPPAGFPPTPVTNQPINPPVGGPAGTPGEGFNVILQPLDALGLATGNPIPTPVPAFYPLTSNSNGNLSGVSYPIDTNYFYVFGNAPPGAAIETGSPKPGTYSTPNALAGTQQPPVYTVPTITITPVAPAVTPPAFTNGPPSMIQSITTPMDPLAPVTGAALTTSPIPINQGVLCATSATSTQLPGLVLPTATTSANPAFTTVPANYLTKVPSMPLAAAYPVKGNYYWVCLRRPANLFAPVSANNPMIVVDATRFPYTDGTAPLGATNPPPPPGITQVPQNVRAGTVSALQPVPGPFSVQRYQPYRGGHAVPAAVPANLLGTAPPAGSTTPIDPRYGYTEQIVVPSVDSQNMMKTQGIYTTTGGTFYATQCIFHTLGWANEFEQGSGNGTPEPWDYLPFNDRDFTSVAELMLVPGCSPGLFTKQFVEFAPSIGTVASIFNAVIPNYGTPQYVAQPVTVTTPATPPAPAVVSTGAAIVGPPLPTAPLLVTLPPPPTGTAVPGYPTLGAPTAPATPTQTVLQAYQTGSTPFTYTDASTASPQPHSYPYLNDEFFYSGFGGLILGGTAPPAPPTLTPLDPGGLVGGAAGDGWFKMLEFFEVPSQAFGAIGSVAAGSNFDWLRQDLKPGQLNLNMIMDEEVFFSVAGDQSISQVNGQTLDADSNPKNPFDQFSQQLLNFTQIVPVTGSAPPTNYVLAGSNPANPQYMLIPPAVGQLSLGNYTPGYSPIPLVVTSIRFNGTPGTALPIVGPGSATAGMAALDPVSYSFFTTNLANTPPAYGPSFYNNGLKTAWVQFLNLRHGGSGYIFGFGTGAVGQNSAVAPVTPPQIIPPAVSNSFYATGIPADRPFRSLSFPDINLTVMRPAALPPTPYTNPVVNQVLTTYTAPVAPSVTPVPVAGTAFAGDPGVRNFTQYLGYPTATYPGTLPPLANLPSGIVPLTSPWNTQYEPVFPPAIPVRRLFQVPDTYRGGTVYLTNMGAPTVTTAPAVALPPYLPIQTGASNASSAGDPYLNNTIPVVPTTTPPYTVTTNLPFASPGAVGPTAYLITPAGVPYIANPSGNNPDLYWPGAAAARLHDGVVGDAAVTVSLPPATVTATFTPPLTTNAVPNPNLGSLSNNDNSQHPYWRSEQLQRIINLTTPRTHQYAVWITVGFFEVIRQGDLGMFVYNPTLAFDIMGPEIGAANGKNVRYRSFYLVDRLRLTGFNPSSPSGFRQAIVYRQRIQ